MLTEAKIKMPLETGKPLCRQGDDQISASGIRMHLIPFNTTGTQPLRF